jgi:hypothetical protein
MSDEWHDGRHGRLQQKGDSSKGGLMGGTGGSSDDSSDDTSEDDYSDDSSDDDYSGKRWQGRI